MPFQTSYMIEWGDCDEAGIVFYPRYFYWLDTTFHRWGRSLGINQRTLRATYGAVTPLMEVGATFRSPASYDDELTVHAQIDEWRDKQFRLSYRLMVGERLIAEGFERRAWAIFQDGKLRGAPIAPEFRAALEGNT
jgi:YbgC/YbaW family acyl-CoA thioester hydrolase